jgi:hypothetical protein
MKRNESILVYSVTGLLVVILAVAILFGNEQGVQAHTSARGAKPLGEIAPSEVSTEGAVADQGSLPEAVADGAQPSNGAGPAGQEGAGAIPKPAPAADTPSDHTAATAAPDASQGPPISVPLNASSPAPAVTEPATDLATQVLMWLGDSKRDGRYRVVTVRKGDTFSELVQRWCGGLEQLEIAESLNEELNLQRLEQGTKVVLPWVEDATLVAAHVARKSKQEAEVKVVTDARDKGLAYVVKSGDKLWNIATARVGQKNAAKFIEEVKALNPELMADPGKLVAGKTIILPR